MKFRREDANDCVGNVIQSERLPESGSFAAEMVFEKGVAQHHDMALGRVGRGGIKTRSKARPHTEECENVRGRARAFDAFRLGTAREIEVRIFESADRFELRRLPAPLEEVRISDWHAISDRWP